MYVYILKLKHRQTGRIIKRNVVKYSTTDGKYYVVHLTDCKTIKYQQNDFEILSCRRDLRF